MRSAEGKKHVGTLSVAAEWPRGAPGQGGNPAVGHPGRHLARIAPAGHRGPTWQPSRGPVTRGRSGSHRAGRSSRGRSAAIARAGRHFLSSVGGGDRTRRHRAPATAGQRGAPRIHAQERRSGAGLATPGDRIRRLRSLTATSGRNRGLPRPWPAPAAALAERVRRASDPEPFLPLFSSVPSAPPPVAARVAKPPRGRGTTRGVAARPRASRPERAAEVE